MKRIIFLSVLIIFIVSEAVVLTSCGPSAKEMYEREQSKNGGMKLDSSFQPYSDYNYPFAIKGIYSFKGNKYFFVSHEYGGFLVPLSNTTEIKNMFSDYLHVKEQHIKDSMIIVNKELEISSLKTRISDLKKQIKHLENDTRIIEK